MTPASSLVSVLIELGIKQRKRLTDNAHFMPN
jgi:hypothetical protein